MNQVACSVVLCCAVFIVNLSAVLHHMVRHHLRRRRPTCGTRADVSGSGCLTGLGLPTQWHLSVPGTIQELNNPHTDTYGMSNEWHREREIRVRERERERERERDHLFLMPLYLSNSIMPIRAPGNSTEF